jgi:hypothetical protein
MLCIATSGVVCADRGYVVLSVLLWEFFACYYAIADEGTTQHSVDMHCLT